MLADIAPYQFKTSAEASAAGKRSVQVRRERAIEQAIADKLPTLNTVQFKLNGQLKIVERQIQETVSALNGENGEVTHANRAQLLKALDTLLDRQRVLLGVPDPGTQRPRQSRADRNQPGLAPLPAAPLTPQPVVSSVPEPMPAKPDSTQPVQVYHIT